MFKLSDFGIGVKAVANATNPNNYFSSVKKNSGTVTSSFAQETVIRPVDKYLEQIEKMCTIRPSDSHEKAKTICTDLSKIISNIVFSKQSPKMQEEQVRPDSSPAGEAPSSFSVRR